MVYRGFSKGTRYTDDVRMKRPSIIIVFLTLLFAFTVAARAQMQMPKPGPEHKKLDYFVGTWATDGDMKPGPMGPGGKFTGTSHDEWMDGGFFMVITPT